MDATCHSGLSHHWS
jgi:hypothetical protein